MKRKRKRILSAALAILLAVLMLSSIFVMIVDSVRAGAAPSQAALQELREKAADLKEQKNSLGAVISELEGERTAIVERKSMLDASIELTRQEIANLTQQIGYLEQDIAEKNEQYEMTLREEEAQTELFRRRVREMEENGDITYLDVLFQAGSFAELLSAMDSINDVIHYDEWVLEQLDQAQQATLLAKLELTEAMVEAENARTEQEEKEKLLTQEIAEAEQLLAAVMADIEGHLEEYDALEEAEHAAFDEIDEMVKELERLEEERRRREAQAAGAHINCTGTYIWPSASSVYVTSLFGPRLHPVYKTWRTHFGIDIGASHGTNIFAADGGVVVTSTYSSSYGNYVMISHGAGNYTLYAHMSQRLVTEGQEVNRGDVIGLVGSTGVSTGPHIHFEVYESGERVDPLQFYSNYVYVG